MKQYLIVLSGILLVVPQAFLFAEGDKPMNPPPRQDNSSTSSSDYWAKQKLEMQKKSTEMRTARYTELKEKGVDVSSITSDLLDATMTDESAFWEALKKIQQALEIQTRTDFVTKLAKQGIDVTQFTSDVIANGQEFWDLVKKLQSTPRPQVSDRPSMNPKVESGGLIDKQAIETSYRKKIVDELAKNGIDTSGFTESVMADPEAFLKLAQSLKGTKDGKNMMNQDKKNPPIKGEGEGKMMEGSGQTMKGDRPTDSQEKKTPPKMDNKPALTEKVRKTLQDKLDKIPSDKRDILLPKMLKTAQAQLDTAKTKSNKVLTRKLQAIVEMIQDEIDSSMDDSLIDSIFTE